MTMSRDEQFSTDLISREGYIDVYLRNFGRTVTIDFGSPDIGITIRGLIDMPIARIADPEVIPDVLAALRSLVGALESL